MTISSYKNLASTILNLIREAKEKGLSAENPIKIRLMGSYMQGDLRAPERTVYISFAAPAIYDETTVWVNPLNRTMFEANIEDKTWAKVFDIADIFAPGSVSHAGSSSECTTGQPVQTLIDLQTINTTTIDDKTLIYVENERAIYAYDVDSIDSGEGIIVPDNGIGRWVLVSNTSGAIANLDGGFF